ncbi:MAG: sensor histidine kinase [Chryseobacterium sp.]|nr:MAG: sensor histidine kinase [Chryseobacterium sp.]
MKSRFQFTLSKKSVYAIAIALAAVVVGALAFLSFLITNEARRSNEEFARKAFATKYESVEREFKAIEDYHYLVADLINDSIENDYSQYFSVLNALNDSRNLVQYNWYFNSKSKRETLEQELLSAALKTNNPTKQWQRRFSGDSIRNFLLQSEGKLYWISYDSLPNHFYYGSTINLDDLHDYFTRVGQNQNNYAFVFTKDGTCMTHPEQKFIGQNIFDLTDIKEEELRDIAKNGNTERTGLSEYLGLEVTRFIKPLKTGNFDGFVAVNYVNLLIDDNVRQTRFYTAIIFLSTFLLILLIFVLFYNATNIAYRAKEKSELEKKQLLIDNEVMHKEQALNQLRQLKSQMNPHFLFNSLNSLYMLIGFNKKKAQEFTMNLSKIYRYLMVPPKHNLVKLKGELTFVEQYMALQQARFAEEIDFKLSINSDEALIKKIPYLALQTALENAIKHNIATAEQPLEICVTVDEDSVTVKNTLQLKDELPQGERFGLQYLQQTYRFFGKTDFSAAAENGYFVCKLPLLD